MHWKCQETEFNAAKMYPPNLAAAPCTDKHTVKSGFDIQTQESSPSTLNPTYPSGENTLVSIFFICSTETCATTIHKGCCEGACDVMNI